MSKVALVSKVKKCSIFAIWDLCISWHSSWFLRKFRVSRDYFRAFGARSEVWWFWNHTVSCIWRRGHLTLAAVFSERFVLLLTKPLILNKANDFTNSVLPDCQKFRKMSEIPFRLQMNLEKISGTKFSSKRPKFYFCPKIC